MSTLWAVYVRRSQKGDDDADVSDETQEAAARRRVPPGAEVEIFKDSGGHNSGGSDERPAYQRMLAALMEGRLAGIAAYNGSRLNRNTVNAGVLYNLCERYGVMLRYDDTPPEQMFTSTTKLTHDIGAAVDENYRRRMSENMKAQMRHTFEQGGHRGNDPFGFKTRRVWNERKQAFLVDHPRVLEPVPEEAETVRRVFALLADHPFSDIADILNREGVKHRATRAWTKNAVKDLWRRREVYRGNVVEKRGLRVAEGRHEAILSEAEYRAANDGVERRVHRRAVKDNNGKRFYLLGGLVFCSCGTKMHGTAQISRGKTWLYYVCPVSERRRAVLDENGDLVACYAKRVRADAADAFVLDALRTFPLPDEVIAAVREEIEQRRKAHKPGDLEKQRDRLEQMLARLGKRFDWGELDEGEYRSKVTEVRRQLAALPSPDDTLIEFDRYRAEVRGFAETVDAGNDEDRRRFVSALVERVETQDRQVVRVVWMPPARIFFREQALLDGEPPGGCEASPPYSSEGLAWYAAS